MPDIRARIPRSTVDGDSLWTEWELSGIRRDRAAFLMRGVVIFTVRRGSVASARFYLEPVDETSGNVDAHTRRVAGTAEGPGPSDALWGGAGRQTGGAAAAAPTKETS